MVIQFSSYVVVFLVIFLMILIWIRSVRYLNGKTYNDYITAYPECFHNGAVRCRWCGGLQLALMRDSSVFGLAHRHVCAQCGSELYRSRIFR